MIAYPQIPPYLFRLGPLQLRWYGLMYVLGFTASYLLVRSQVRRRSLSLGAEELRSLYSWCIVGLLAGLGYAAQLHCELHHEHHEQYPDGYRRRSMNSRVGVTTAWFMCAARFADVDP